MKSLYQSWLFGYCSNISLWSHRQIYEGDLFDFDMEVEAMLEVLCGRTIEQAVMEVMEDHQLAHIRMHQVLHAFKNLRGTVLRVRFDSLID